MCSTSRWVISRPTTVGHRPSQQNHCSVTRNSAPAVSAARRVASAMVSERASGGDRQPSRVGLRMVRHLTGLISWIGGSPRITVRSL